jgi:hypothetical protein
MLAAVLTACIGGQLAVEDDGDDSTEETTGEEAEQEADEVTEQDQAALPIDPDVNVLDVKPDRSVLITAPGAVGYIGDKLPLGILLKRVGKAAISEWAPAEGAQSQFPLSRIHDWVRNPFVSAEREFREHDDLPSEKRLGLRHGGNPYRRVQDLWPSLASADVGGGPFRLLAVVNRMDLAGDIDERGIIDAAKAPRNFGEARLIFGLVDKTYETNTGKPYPMTFIIEYRLPALDANNNMIAGYNYAGKLFAQAEWQTQMERWGKVWRQLSAWEPGSDAYRDHLAKIVARFAKPENFVALRANLELRRDGKVEYELREWYMLKQNNWVLIPRKPRDEPYACGDNADLAKMVQFYWDPIKMDVNMARVTPAAPQRVIGYNIPRTVKQSPIAMGDTLAGCPVNATGVPTRFEMAGTDGEQHRITAPFGRAKVDQVWKMPSVSEDRRHQFAIRTCTGCHSKEAGVFGFHVLPRLPKERSRLSPFLTGGATFTHGARMYSYNELEKRRSYVARASAKDPALALFEGLYRRD